MTATAVQPRSEEVVMSTAGVTSRSTPPGWTLDNGPAAHPFA
ncbi:hypothetical protein ABZ863_23565 [Saccharomonospora sp. NPDC046836]